jgi:signal transduction histidine kinase
MALFPEMNPGPVIRTDESGVILLVNAAARELFASEQLPGQRWLDVCPGVDLAVWKQVLGGADKLSHVATIGERTFSFTYRRPAHIPSVFIYGNDITLLRAAEGALRNAEKMAMLGTLAAGVAHELNNPAAAATRGADQLRDALGKLQDAFVPLSQLHLSPERATKLLALVRQDRDSSALASHIDPLTRSDFESDVESWLDERGIPDPWELAPALASLGYDPAELARVADEWGNDTATIIGWIARAQPVLALAREIEEATRRISDIARALKTYSFLGEAPVRPVDVAEGIDNTLLIMRNKLKDGVVVHREYAADLPLIQGLGSELNQVWTNIIDNAIDAMGGKGQIVVRARREGTDVIVVIEDDGPGMPENVRQYIFDPFFTTKEPGRGTGLGLSTTRNVIVKKHGGSIDVTSRPGCTRFTIRLPIQHPAARAPDGQLSSPVPND